MENNQKKLILLKDLGMKHISETSKHKKRYGLYKCFCGEEFVNISQSVKDKSVKSCGCLLKTHNLSYHRLYRTWQSMLSRCTNPKNTNYKSYGGRGVTVCDEWLDINNFVNDMYPSFIEGLTLDRKENDKGYSKDNCRWATKTTQSRNTALIYKGNTTGLRGVSKYKDKFICHIMINNKKKHLGIFNTKLEAGMFRDKYIIDNNLEHTLNFNRE